MAKSKTTHPEGGVEKFLVLPIIVLILAQMGTSGDNGALGLANQQLVDVLARRLPTFSWRTWCTRSWPAPSWWPEDSWAPSSAGAPTSASARLCAPPGELVMALSPNMTIFIWGGRILVGFGASFMIPSVLGLIPFIYHGQEPRAGLRLHRRGLGPVGLPAAVLGHRHAVRRFPHHLRRPGRVLRPGAASVLQAAGHREAR